MEEIGVGLVGAGLISDQHALAFQRVKGARVLAVADPDTARARKLADRYGLDAGGTTTLAAAGSSSARTWT